MGLVLVFFFFKIQIHIFDTQGNNFTYDPDQGRFSEDNLMSLDQRGFKTLILQEADEFLSVQQRLMLNATVRTVAHSQDGVNITLANGATLFADYALCTFSLGVLQNDDVQFQPLLPRKYHNLPFYSFTNLGDCL